MSADTTPCARCNVGWTEHTFRTGVAKDHPFTTRVAADADERHVVNRDDVTRALLALSDTLDEDEGPVILAWRVPQLVDAIMAKLRSRTSPEVTS